MVRRCGWIIFFLLLSGVSGCADSKSVTLSPTLTIATTAPNIVETKELPPTTISTNTLLHRLKSAGTFTRFVDALEKADLTTMLDATDGKMWTLFAPTDVALDTLSPTTWDALQNDPKGKLTTWLNYYIVAGEALSAEEMVNKAVLMTLNGEAIKINYENSQLLINGTTKITTADIRAKNGMLHIIDQWLFPPSETTDVLPPLPSNGQTLTQLMVGRADLNIWLSAVAATPLGKILADPTSAPVTLFAPTDQAIGKLSPELRQELLENSAESLFDTIQTHILNTPVSAEAIGNRPNWVTQNGQTLTVRLVNGEIILGENTRIIATLEGSNGLLYIVDNLLQPSR